MGTATVQCNTRMDAALKRSGDAVLERCGVTPSEAVRALWDYAATNQSLPPFVLAYARAAKSRSDAEGTADPRSRAQRGCGLAVAVARAECPFSPKPSPEPHAAPDWRELRDAMYDEMLAERELRRR